MRRISIAAAALVGVVALTAQAALATPITVSASVIGSGILGGDVFTDALVTFSAVTDTDDVIGHYQINNIPLDVTVAGLGEAAFTDDMGVVANSLANDIGFGDFTGGLALLFVGDFPGGYDLKSSFTLTGPSMVNPGASYNTDAGTFSFRSTGEAATFTAKLSAAPEPGAWALMIAGFGLTGAALRRRRAGPALASESGIL